MEKMNKFVSLLLVIALFLPSVPAYAIAPVEIEDADEQPLNPPGTPEGVQCSGMGVKPAPLVGVCCVGLQKNQAGVCDELVFEDPALVTCTSGATCAPGTGCYPQSASDLFSSASPSSEDPDDLSEKNKSIQAQIAEVSPKPAGSSCSHPKECSSYSCDAGVCKDVSVCRYAKEGEIAPAGVDCVKDLVKGAGGKCERSPEDKNGVYLGLLKEATIHDAGQCQFELDEETRKQAIIAMSSLRAMEYFYSTINMTPDQDCFSVAPLLKEAVGKPFYETRKNILTNFTDVLNGIEFDFKQLIEAKEKGTKNLTIHNDEQIVEADLATRQTSGYDNLVMLYRRNLLFQSYEQSMLGTVQAANVTLSKLAKGMNTWQSGSKSWDLAGQTLSYQCEGSKYKVRPFLKWKTKYYENVADRWANYWEVTGSAGANSEIVKRPMVAKNLALFSGSSEEQAIADFTKKFYMIDPLMFSGMSQGQYGSPKALKKKGGFLGLPIFGGFKDLRHAYYIDGSGSGSFKTMYSQIKPKLRDFYKALKTKSGQKNFIYEPELVTTEAKACLDEGEATAKCVDFEKFLEDTQDEIFAQFLAYGHSNNDSYANYFESATSYRRRLMAKMEVDMANISKYYTTVIEQRNKQNACIEKVVGGIIDSGILVTDDNGLNEGGSTNNSGTTSGSGAGGTLSSIPKGVGATKLPNLRLSPLTRAKYSYDLTGSSLKKLNNVSNLDGINDSSLNSGRAGFGTAEQAFLSARKEAMKNANSKASSAGVNVASKEKAVKDIINSMNKKSLSSTGSASGSGSRGGSGFGSDAMNAGKAGLGADLKGAGTGKEEIATGEGVNGNKVVDGTASGDTNLLAGVESGSGSGAGHGAGSGADGAGGANDPNAGRDGTGLTDAEKDKLMADYEKNKRDFESSEEDGLFGKVSKAYVRNLDKVLNKKKKLPND